jgi:phosphatidylethanolamine-binding protein (PEBP) family uncharacterized protein
MIRNCPRFYFKVILVFCSLISACSNVSSDAVELKVDFSWAGMKPCGWGNPEIHVEGLPENTKSLKVSMYDSVYLHDHGEVILINDGSGIIPIGTTEELQGPCPPDVPGRYEITVKALDENNVVIGIGSKKRYFPEEK